MPAVGEGGGERAVCSSSLVPPSEAKRRSLPLRALRGGRGEDVALSFCASVSLSVNEQVGGRAGTQPRVP